MSHFKIIKLWLAVLGIFVLSACGGEFGEDENETELTERQRFEQNWQLWSSHKPLNYAFTWRELSSACDDCDGEIHMLKLDTEFYSFEEQGRTYTKRDTAENLILKLFNAIEAALGAGESLEVTYDASWGYPIQVVFEKEQYEVNGFYPLVGQKLELTRNEIKWAKNKPERYSYQMQMDCFCEFHGEFNIGIWQGGNSEIFWITGDRYVLDYEYPELPKAMVAYFALIDTAINEGQQLELEYDELGFPSLIKINEDLQPVDGGLTFRLSGLEEGYESPDLRLLAEQRTKFESYQLAGYEFSFTQINAMDERARDRYLVQDDQTVERINIRNFHAEQRLLLSSMNDIFELAQQAMLDPPSDFTVVYDGLYGFPQAMLIDGVIYWIDEFSEQGNEALNELYRHNALWYLNGFASYNIYFDLDCNCEKSGFYQLKNVLGSVSGWAPSGTQRELTEQELSLLPYNVERIFELAKTAILQNNLSAPLSFDPVLGVPLSINLNYFDTIYGVLSLEVQSIDELYREDLNKIDEYKAQWLELGLNHYSYQFRYDCYSYAFCDFLDVNVEVLNGEIVSVKNFQGEDVAYEHLKIFSIEDLFRYTRAHIARGEASISSAQLHPMFGFPQYVMNSGVPGTLDDDWWVEISRFTSLD